MSNQKGLTLRIRNPKTKKFQAAYIAPDGSDTFKGELYLSDAIDSDLNAENGITAATPAAVKYVWDNSLSKTTANPQTVVSPITFTSPLKGTIEKATKIEVSQPIGSYNTPIYIDENGNFQPCEDEIFSYSRIGVPAIDYLFEYNAFPPKEISILKGALVIPEELEEYYSVKGTTLVIDPAIGTTITRTQLDIV